MRVLAKPAASVLVRDSVDDTGTAGPSNAGKLDPHRLRIFQTLNGKDTDCGKCGDCGKCVDCGCR